MQRICRQCGTQYQGKPGSTLCPNCVAVNRKNVIRDRTCRGCGAVFPGGPRAWYCPDCRRDRRRAASQRARRNGTARPIGSIDRCEICSGEYTVSSGRQRYCPACAPQAVAAVDREQGRQWHLENGNADRRRDQRRAGTAMIPCKVCGELFAPTDSSLTCSPNCSREHNRRLAKVWETDHRQQRNDYRRERRARIKDNKE